LPTDLPVISFITELTLRIHIERVRRSRSLTLYTREYSLVSSSPEILRGLRELDERYNRPQIVSRAGYAFERELLLLPLIALTYLVGSAFLIVLLAITLVHSDPTQLLGRLFVTIHISRTVSEHIVINETPENIQIRAENPEPLAPAQVRERVPRGDRFIQRRRTLQLRIQNQQRIRQAQLAALAEQEAAAEAGLPLPPSAPIRIPAPRNPDFEPEQADHSALESESEENFNYPT
jgi:hypothetical protein